VSKKKKEIDPKLLEIIKKQIKKEEARKFRELVNRIKFERKIRL